MLKSHPDQDIAGLRAIIGFSAPIIPSSDVSTECAESQNSVQYHELERKKQQSLKQAEALSVHADFSTEIDNHSDASRHRIQNLLTLASARQLENKQRMLQTGKPFWELENLDEWARHGLKLQQENTLLGYTLLIEQIPITENFAYTNRLRELKREAIFKFDYPTRGKPQIDHHHENPSP